ncbi:ADP/ATP translocase [Toxoplasma gondii]|uniref:ADP/ATP translocase n=1 Tax=Toxoplasma gondii TaxID=5811 RepID=A0A7J6JSI0_TOXGO|nr:ADP/ATP translocase [Toxoplasma gondii]
MACPSSSSPPQTTDFKALSASFLRDFLMGGLAGGISKTFVAPVERVKLLLQLQDASTQIGHQEGQIKKYEGLKDCFVRVHREQGLYSFWRGNWANVVRYFPTQALNFACKEKYQKLFVRHDPKQDFWKFFAETLASGGAAGATSLSFVYPLDFARTRLGADVGKVQAERQFTGLNDCIRKIYQELNFAKRGGARSHNAPRTNLFMPQDGVSFRLSLAFRAMLPSDKKVNHPVMRNFAIGLGVETAAGVIAYPLDTVRRRMMMQALRSDTLYRNTWDCAGRIAREEGVAAYYKGCASNIVRGVGGAIVLVLYDEMKRFVAS